MIKRKKVFLKLHSEKQFIILVGPKGYYVNFRWIFNYASKFDWLVRVDCMSLLSCA